jgi:hypothetical protein
MARGEYRKNRPSAYALILLGILGIILSTADSAQAQTTYQAYNIGEAQQPARGGSYRDPIFGTQVLRVTDSTDANIASVAYSYWSVFNSNSQMFILGLDYKPYLYKFDPNALKFNKLGPLFGDDSMQWEGLSWSATDPDTVYGVSGRNSNVKLRAYNVSTGQYAFEHDFTAAGELPVGMPWQMSKARSNDRYFSFHWRPAEDQPIKFAVVYDKETNKTYKFDVQDPVYGRGDFDECRLDRDGRYLFLFGKEENYYVWQFAVEPPERRVMVKRDELDRAGGHYDIGSGLLIQADIWEKKNGNRLIRRSLSNPTAWKDIFDSGVEDFQNDHHISMTGPDDSWALVTTMTYTTPNYIYPFTNEIFLIRTDGSGKVQRLLQHRSSNREYFATPRGNLSPDGRFVAYTSDWGGGHIDVYIAVLPEAVWNQSTTKKPAATDVEVTTPPLNWTGITVVR